MRIGVFGSEYQVGRQNVIRRLFDKLVQLEAVVYVDRRFYAFLEEKLDFHPKVDGLLDDDDFDLTLALSVGGDGTFLRTAARVNKKNIPILGINTGRLGFLADVGSNEIEDMLDEIFKNYYKVEERTLLRLHTHERAFHGYNYALNEIAVLKRDSSSMITIHTFLNGEYLTSYQADGLVIATPTFRAESCSAPFIERASPGYSRFLRDHLAGGEPEQVFPDLVGWPVRDLSLGNRAPDQQGGACDPGREAV